MQLQVRRSRFGFKQSGRQTAALIGSLFCLFLAFAASARSEESRSVLFLNSYGPDFAPYNFLTANLRNDLTTKYRGFVDYYDASLTGARYAEGGHDKAFADFLQTLFHERRLDLVIAIGAPAARFVQKNRHALFSQIPMLLTAVEQRRLDPAAHSPNDFVVAFSLDLPAMITNIMTVLPETETVEVVIGNSPNERFWLSELKKEFAQFESKLKFNYLDQLPFDDLLKRLSQTPAKTAIFLGPFTVDGAGNVLQGDRTLEKLRRNANAPIFSYVDAYFGDGIVGGPQISLTDMSERAAEIAATVLRGERPSFTEIPPIQFATPVYDWRELQRWGISEWILPAGSAIEFRSLGIWERYRQFILLVVFISALQFFLILGLLANRRSLRKEQAERERAESEAHELSGRLIHAHEDERARLARELHDDDGQGFDPVNSVGKANLGQASMRQRIRHLGGDLAIESAPGKGTVIRAWLPLGEDNSEPSKGFVG